MHISVGKFEAPAVDRLTGEILSKKQNNSGLTKRKHFPRVKPHTVCRIGQTSCCGNIVAHCGPPQVH